MAPRLSVHRHEKADKEERRRFRAKGEDIRQKDVFHFTLPYLDQFGSDRFNFWCYGCSKMIGRTRIRTAVAVLGLRSPGGFSCATLTGNQKL